MNDTYVFIKRNIMLFYYSEKNASKNIMNIYFFYIFINILICRGYLCISFTHKDSHSD